MENIILQAPSKTFLIGEYLVTQGGTALIANTPPYFKLKIQRPQEACDLVLGISSTSPAGQFLKRHLSVFKNYNLEFSDPHEGLGGFGASSAQYALLLSVYLLQKNPKGSTLDLLKKAFSFLEEYILDCWDKEGIRPSGADMLAQMAGNISIVTPSKAQISYYRWPFKDVAFSLFHTGHKLATHEHLKKFRQTIPTEKLQEILNFTVEAFKEKNSFNFVNGLSDYQKALASLGLQCENSSFLIKKIYAFPETLAAKGCGAMGSDVIAVIYHTQDQSTLELKVKNLGLKLVANSSQLGRGIFNFSTKEKLAEIFA